jgi:hypothetical protein
MPTGVYKRTQKILAAVEAGRACASKRRPPKCGIQRAETNNVTTISKQVSVYWRKKHGPNNGSSHAKKMKNQKKSLANNGIV